MKSCGVTNHIKPLWYNFCKVRFFLDFTKKKIGITNQ